MVGLFRNLSCNAGFSIPCPLFRNPVVYSSYQGKPREPELLHDPGMLPGTDPSAVSRRNYDPREKIGSEPPDT